MDHQRADSVARIVWVSNRKYHQVLGLASLRDPSLDTVQDETVPIFVGSTL